MSVERKKFALPPETKSDREIELEERLAKMEEAMAKLLPSDQKEESNDQVG